MVNIGVIGCANIAERYMLPNLVALGEEFTLVGIASRSYSKARNMAERFQTNPMYPYDALFDVSDLDAVYIPLPNSLHEEWVERALERGLHVIVEKSLATTASAVRRLNNSAQARNLVLLENFQFQYHSQLMLILDMVKSGIIGDLRCIRSSFGFPPFKDTNNIRYKKELGGGALLDVGAYPIKISQILMGEDICVGSASLHWDEITGVDLWGGGFIKQKSGDLFSEIAFGFDCHYQCSLELWGSKGKIFTNRIFTAPPGYVPTIVLETDYGIKEISLPPDNHFRNMLLYFHDTVMGLLPPEYAQNIRQAELIEEFLRVANG